MSTIKSNIKSETAKTIQSLNEYNKYQSWEWVNIQQEIEEDENSGSIMDEFNDKN